MPVALAVVLAGLGGACAGLWLAVRARARLKQAGHAWAHELDRLRSAALREGQALRLQSEVAVREEALLLRARAEAELHTRQADLAAEEAALAGRTVGIDEELHAIAELRADLSRREVPLAELERETQASRAELESLRARFRAELEGRAGQSAADVARALTDGEVEDTRARAGQSVRNASEALSGAEVARAAKRLMGIAGGRMADRFYSERAQALVPLPEPRTAEPALAAEDLRLIEGAAGVTLSFTEAGDAVRIEGLDGVGREIARRCITRMLRRAGARATFAKLAADVTAEVEREITDFGQRAFAILRIDRPHEELVRLVGRLNFRTSYSQNQWEHSVEAGFLCGMIAAELDLDVKLARRAALLHDIGKALTHELDGSHAVIGADYARRFGEGEMVANAIGAHHTDEPFASAYAHLVAAADAMSGGRPGSRRQSEDNHVAKLAEIERIARSFRGVGEAFAVQGGREVRVYVEENRVSDVAAGKLATDIAAVISRELTFPGQIKVTVIREFKAVEMAS